MAITRGQAKQLRKLLIKQADNLPDEEILNVPCFVEKWKAGISYVTGKRLKYNDVIYRVLQDHTSQDDWTPDVAPSLFSKILIPDETVVPEWEQPDSTNPYMTGDKVTHNGSTWASTCDNNVWEPGVYGWNKV